MSAHDATALIARILKEADGNTLGQGELTRKVRGRVTHTALKAALSEMMESGALRMELVETTGRIKRAYTLIEEPPAPALRPVLARSQDFALVTALRANEAALRDVNETLRAILNRLP